MNHIVVGAGFGDEGKGQTVSNLVSDKDIRLVIRFNGGHQAGHTVELGGIRHVFSNFGAGSLQNVPTYWGRFCTINPPAIKKEFEILQTKGCTPILYIDPLCPVTTPLDILANEVAADITQHGSVGVGFGTTIARQEAFFNLFAEDLKVSSIMLNKIKSIAGNYYKKQVDEEALAEWFDAVTWLLNHPTIKIKKPSEFPSNIVFEGAQGLLLDQDFGFFPHVTRSKTTPYNAFRLISELQLRPRILVHHVSRVYHTRHGNGPFSKQNADFLKDGIVETNQDNYYQGCFKIAPLNIDWLRYAIKMSQEENLYNRYKNVFTCADHVKDLEHIPVIKDDKLCTMSLEELKRSVNKVS